MTHDEQAFPSGAPWPYNVPGQTLRDCFASQAHAMLEEKAAVESLEGRADAGA